jgi:hypothetical protein
VRQISFTLKGGSQIDQLPKIKVKFFGFPDEDICSLDQAGHLFGIKNMMVLVDGQRIGSYDDLVQLIAQDRYKDKQSIEVVLLPAIAGG